MANGREPLRIPQSWKDQARAFVVQLERILDKLFNRVESNAKEIGDKLPLSGGTVTGNILLQQNSVDASKANNNVSSTIYPTTNCILDKNGRIISRVECVVEPTGEIRQYSYVRNYNTSGTQVGQKGLKMTMDKSGNLTWNVDNPSNFRSAIGTDKAVKSITRSGTTFTATCLDDTTFTFTQQDNDHYAWSDITGKPSTFAPSAHTHDKIVTAGDNVASTSTNTYAHGNLNVRWFSQTGKLPGQPAQYGFLLTLATGDNVAETHQLWFTQANGSLLHRGTNGSSYTSPPTFAYILDSNNYTSFAAKSTEAIKNITRSGTTFTATRCDGTTFTFTQQDNNTWRGFQSKGYSYSYSIGAGAILNVSGSNLGVSTPSGYTPVGFKQLVSGNNDVDIVSYRADQTGAEWVVRLHNRASSTKTGSVYVVIFYMQS